MTATKYPKLTATELKYRVRGSTDSYFFDRDSMKFFGDTMANYYVLTKPVQVTTASGNVHTCYVLTRRRPVKHGLSSNAYFDVETFARILPAKG